MAESQKEKPKKKEKVNNTSDYWTDTEQLLDSMENQHLSDLLDWLNEETRAWGDILLALFYMFFKKQEGTS